MKQRKHGEERIINIINGVTPTGGMEDPRWPNLRRVKDAPRAYNLRVTPEDVRIAKRKDHHCCVVAKACAHDFSNVLGAYITTSRAYLIVNDARGDGATALRFRINKALHDQIIAFDKGKGFEAGTYPLDVVRDINKLGPRSGAEGRKTGVRGHRVAMHLRDFEIRTAMNCKKSKS